MDIIALPEAAEIRLVQLHKDGRLRVALVKNPDTLQILAIQGGSYALGKRAIEEKRSLRDIINSLESAEQVSYQNTIDQGALLPPVTHPDSAHCLVSGTGLTHLGSAGTRDAMHVKLNDPGQAMTDSMKMFKLGLEGGKPGSGEIGAQPEWFYKGDGDSIVAPYAPIPVPAFALDSGEEPELVGLYLIGDDRKPYRLGFAIGNEFSDHVTERQNYLWLAHSKLRHSSFGPELLVAEVPRALQGTSRVLRRGQTDLGKDVPDGRGKHVPHNRQPRTSSFQVYAIPSPGRSACSLLWYCDTELCGWCQDSRGRRIRDPSAGVWTAAAQFVALNSGGRSRCCCVALNRAAPD